MHSSSKEAKPSSASYLILIFAVPIILLASAFAVANTSWFLYHDNYFLLRNIGYSLTLRHADCQVVLAGDSSALTGLDPVTVTRMTGLSACNVAEGGTVTGVAGSFPLDTYLKNNAPPRYIVFMFTPSMYRPSRWWGDYTTYYEGIVYLLQYKRDMDTYEQLLKHPYETFSFAGWAAQGILADAVNRLIDPHHYDGIEDPAVRRQRHGGLFTFYSPPESRCLRNGRDKGLHVVADPGWVAGLRQKYGVNGTRVFVDIAPVADCDDMKESYERALKGVHDNPLEVLPIGMFNNGDVHFTAEGAVHVSASVANQILSAQGASAPKRTEAVGHAF